jgi:hypothetical protein
MIALDTLVKVSLSGKALRFRRKTGGKPFGGMASDVQNSELAIGEFTGNGSFSHANSEFGTSCVMKVCKQTQPGKEEVM